MTKAFEPVFDYSVWTPNTSVMLCQVPWDNSYRDVVRFESEESRAAYFAVLSRDAYAITLDGLVYLRYGEPIRIAVPFSAVNHANYIVVKNQRQPVPDYGLPNLPDTFYYFVNDVRYIAPNCTELDVQLDVWMTYYDRVTFGVCYIERGHIGIANENSTLYNTAEYLIEPEGLEVGRNYYVQDTHWQSFVSEAPWVVVMSSAELIGDYGTKDNPVLTTAKGSINDGLPNGCVCYAMDGDNFLALMQALSNAPWVSQCIQSITLVPRVFCDVENDPVTLGGNVTAYPLNDNPQAGQEITQYEIKDIASRFAIPEDFSELLKLYTHPYAVIETSNYQGNALTYSVDDLFLTTGSDGKPAYRINVKNCTNPPFIRGYVYPNQMHTGKRADVRFFDYKVIGSDATYSTVIDNSDQFEGAIVYENFPQCAVVNNQYALYLASTANTRNYQAQSAGWTQQKALTAAQLSYDQSTAGINTSLENTRAGIGAAWGQNAIANEQAAWGGVQSVIGAGMGAVSSGASGNLGGVAGSAASGALGIANATLQQGWNNQSTAISTGLSATQAVNRANLQRYTRDTNYDYAQFAAKGDYSTAIAAINAKVQDAALTPPTISANTGGDAFNMSQGYCGVVTKFKTCAPQFLQAIGSFWLKYGYAINRWITPPSDLRCMTKWTYWKMQNASIFAQIPELHKNAIRGIFEKGVTVWTDPAAINLTPLSENKTITGVRY